jgi:aquaporin Z
VPGPGGPWVVFVAEAIISFVLIIVVLFLSNRPELARWTGIVAGLCVAMFITFESPFSGMSMNPARTVGSALLPGLWKSVWIYFTAPPIGMLLGAAFYTLRKGRVLCAKFHHENQFRCIFCEYQSAKEKGRELTGALKSGSTLAENLS